MRCPDCGTARRLGTNICPGCGSRPAVAAAVATVAPQVGGLHLAPQSPPGALYAPAPRQAAMTPMPAPALPGRVLPAAENFPSFRAQLSGSVFAVEQVPGEPPDFDLCRVLSRIVWLAIVVLSPLALLHAALTGLGALPALLLAVLLWFGLKWISPANLLSLLHLNAMLNPASRRDEAAVPIRYLRIRADDGREAVARIKGRFTLGNIAPNDFMSFWGTWRGGVLRASRAFNHRTGSRIEIESAQSWTRLAIALGALVLVVGYFTGNLS